MESLFDTIKNTQETKFEIIGKEHQVLQLVLYPGDGIETSSTSLLYMSPNIKKKKKTQNFKKSLM